jgi:hypothetical protein
MAKADRKLTEGKIGYARYGSGPGRCIKRLVQKRASSARLIGADETLRVSDGVSNAVDERPGLSELLAKRKREEVDTVIVEDCARLSRSADKAASSLAFCSRPVSSSGLRQKGGCAARVKAAENPCKSGG